MSETQVIQPENSNHEAKETNCSEDDKTNATKEVTENGTKEEDVTMKEQEDKTDPSIKDESETTDSKKDTPSTENGPSSPTKRKGELNEAKSPSKRRKTEPKEEVEDPKIGKWKDEGAWSVLNSSALTSNEKIFAFDLDGTLIVKPGKNASKKAIVWFHECVPEKLRKLHEEEKGKVVIFTSQSGKAKAKKAKVKQIQEKILEVVKLLGFPIQAVISDEHHKPPALDSWKYFTEFLNPGVTVDLQQSVFVGDSAGRVENWKEGAKKDSSSVDRKFAYNIGLPFKTPEEFFLGETSAKFVWGSLDFDTLSTGVYTGEPLSTPLDTEHTVTIKSENLTSDKPELVVLVGLPSSGKSNFAKKVFSSNGYEILTRDTLKTADFVQAVEKVVKEGKSVVVDDMNPSKEIRKKYIELAKAKEIPVRCFFFQVPDDLAHHLNHFRERTNQKGTKKGSWASFRRQFVAPTSDEGFLELKHVNFALDLQSEEEKQLFFKHA